MTDFLSKWYTNLRNYTTSRVDYWSDRWAFEFLSCVIAMCCLLAIVVTLSTYQNQPLPQWPKGISVNTIISIFTAILKAALMVPISEGLSQLKWLWFRNPQRLIALEELDRASRGPLGAMSLMFRQHKHYLATFGAFLTIAVLAIDPFSQQILEYYTCMQTLPGLVARIPRSNNCTYGAVPRYPEYDKLHDSMIKAILIADLAIPNHRMFDVKTECRTGNCTFPSDMGATFSTIAMCSSLADVSGQIRHGNRTGNYWLPGRVHNQSAEIGYTSDSRDFKFVKFSGIETLARNENFDELIAIDMLMFQFQEHCDSYKQNSSLCRMNPSASRISFYPCVKTYKTSMADGQLNETIVLTNRMKRSYPAGQKSTLKNMAWSLATDRVLRNGRWETCVTSKNFSAGTPVSVSTDQTILMDGHTDIEHLWYPEDCVWYLHPVSALVIYRTLRAMYDGSRIMSTDQYDTFKDSIWLQDYYRKSSASLDIAEPMITRMAEVLTWMMRQHGQSQPDDYALGTVQAAHTCISVRWAWLSLPASLVLLTITFLGVTIWKCVATQTWQGSWKSSILALIFHGLEAGSSNKLIDVELRSDMKERAKHLRMQMASRDGRTVFVNTDVI